MTSSVVRFLLLPIFHIFWKSTETVFYALNLNFCSSEHLAILSSHTSTSTANICVWCLYFFFEVIHVRNYPHEFTQIQIQSEVCDQIQIERTRIRALWTILIILTLQRRSLKYRALRNKTFYQSVDIRKSPHFF